MAAEHTPNIRLLMFPYLAYGHITPFLELAKKLSDRGFSIGMCSTPINLSFIKENTPQKYSSSIQLVEFHLPDLPELPPHYHTTHGLPHHLQSTLYKALSMGKPQLYQILKDQKPDMLVYDVMQPWAAGVATSLNIPSIRFCNGSGAACCYFGHFHYKPGVEFPFPALYLKDYEQEIVRHIEVEKEAEGERIMLLNTSRAIDGMYIDYISEIGGNSDILTIGAAIRDVEDAGDMEETELIKWLGKKKEHSTVYVAFGSEYVLTKEEMEEVAFGLELSNVNFIWVVRFPSGEEVKLEEALPQGFLERIGERGRIVEGWVPQTRILKHPSTAAFVTHCGWNSTLEGIEFGVPMIALPMSFGAQSTNARLIVEIGVGVEIARDGNGKLHRGNIAETIKDVIFGQKTGEDLRRKVKSLGENIKLLTKEEMDGVAKVIKQVCEKNRSKNALA